VFREAFSKYGTVATENIGKLMLSCGRFIYDDKKSEVDADASGTIDFQEFLARVAKVPEDERAKKYIDQFHRIDKDNNGFITAGELQEDMNLTDETAKNMLGSTDFDKDGRIHLEEFVKMRFGYRAGKGLVNQ